MKIDGLLIPDKTLYVDESQGRVLSFHPMGPWRLLSGSHGHPRSYERTLGLNELGFYWDSAFNGTADTLQHATVEVRAGLGDKVFSVENVMRTWICMKQRFPLLGSQLLERGKDEVVFVVAEERLSHCHTTEIGFHDVLSSAEAQEFIGDVVTGERLLSNDQVARLFILSPTNQTNYFYVLLHLAHCITDGMANSALLRTFLNTLCSPTNDTNWELEDRLSLSVASEDLYPVLDLTLAKQRWRKAIGHIVSSIRMAKVMVVEVPIDEYGLY